MQPMSFQSAFAYNQPIIYESIDVNVPSEARVFIQMLYKVNEDWIPIPLKEKKREPMRMFLRQILDPKKFQRNAFEDNQIWIQNSTSVRLLGDLTKEYTILLRSMNIIRKNKFVENGHMIYPNWMTTNQKEGECQHEFGIILKIGDGSKFTDEEFQFFV